MTKMKKEVENQAVPEVEALQAEIAKLKEQLGQKSTGRKEQLLAILKTGRTTIKDAAEQLGITERNVSTLKCYLSKDGWNFGKDSKGRLYIEE